MWVAPKLITRVHPPGFGTADPGVAADNHGELLDEWSELTILREA